MSVLIHKEISDKVLGAVFAVHNVLGPGLLESAYEGALVIELKHRGLSFERQQVYPLSYKGALAGHQLPSAFRCPGWIPHQL